MSGSDALPGLSALLHFTLGVALSVLHAVFIFGAEPGGYHGPASYIKVFECATVCATVRNNPPPPGPPVLALIVCMAVDVRKVTGSSQTQLPADIFTLT